VLFYGGGYVVKILGVQLVSLLASTSLLLLSRCYQLTFIPYSGSV